ncbi:hypothetical protein C1H46_032294 [Malus baccata]|uniref:Endonuclease/exonuclease/phosphatase domain-containing protein n=1 Tax=Malus baccata TaxID=106549 RepID=A0A540L764_MALBA|nr:hypothetical protein C1H46_032294 [Malus baccata]
MKLLYWNARGVANASTCQVIARMVRSHHPFMLCLLEPFVSLSSIKPSMWRALRLFPVATNDRGSQEPNLWLLCHVDVTPIVLSVTNQQLTVSCILDSVSCTIAYVCAKTTVVARHQLWYDLAYVKSFFVNGPWAIIGDFNCVLGAYVYANSCSEFQMMSSVCELVHLPTKGLSYTRGCGVHR